MAPNAAGEPGDGPDDGDDSDDGDERDAGVDVEARLHELHDHLAATAELPVETAASRWLGEAEAVAADAVRGDPPTSAIATRVRQVRELLSHVEGTGHESADQHVEAARALAAELAASVGECDESAGEDP